MDPQTNATPRWPLGARIGFRFAALYLPAYLVVAITHLGGASSDTAAVWRLLAFTFPAAITGTLIWSWLDRRRPSYPRLHRLLDGLIRFVVIAAMIMYGLDKIFLGQFPSPDAHVLQTPLGQFAPIQLLWAFMGYSPLYQAFGGAAELAGAVLLSFRRTRLLGVLLLIGVMTNVFLLNVSYDVCVKLLSGHLLLMALFLLAPDVPRLIRFFLAAPAPIARGPVLKWTHRAAAAVLALLCAFIARGQITRRMKEAQVAARPPPSGLYDVVGFKQDGVALDATVAARWKNVRFADPYFFFDPEKGDSEYFHFTRSTQGATSGTVTVADDDKPQVVNAPFAYSVGADGTISLDGTWRGHAVHTELHRMDVTAFPLIQHGRHWVKERFE